MKHPIKLFLFCLILPGALFPETATVKALALDTRTGEKIFTEINRMRIENGYALTSDAEFRNAQGILYSKQSVRVKKSPVAPDYLFDDLRDGHREGVSFNGNNYEIFFRADAKSKEEKIPLKIPGGETDTVTFPGFANFVIKNWDVLLQGKPVYFYLIVPTQRDYYRFRLVRDSVTGAGPDAKVHFRIELGNFLLRLFVDAIRISFDIPKKQLIRYEGIHFVRDLPRFLGRKLRVHYIWN